MTNNFLAASKSQENCAAFGAKFLRCYRVLHFIACRVLGGPERAEHAVQNCWRRASRNPPRFEYESEFRSWLLRVLIDEALAILRENQESARGEIGFRRYSFGARNQLDENELCC